ncbi:metallophosphoesterase [Georgenia yuyongxinii]|uniref:metallophosphoesterase family protein n=1 Tax=Georgenia yuyongxinii TaxID=2589797 RepID=UPI00143DC2B4|nr:metallophosphoesterase [Georgenia yuyongxinii]
MLASAAALSAVAALVVPAMQPHRPAGYSPEVLDGTPLADARITGRLADVVAAYGPVVKGAYLDNEKFYDTATANLVAAYAADPEPHASPAKPAVAPAGHEVATPEEGATPENGVTPEEDAAAPEISATPEGVHLTEGVGGEAAAPADDEAAAAEGARKRSETPVDEATADAPEPDPVTLLLVSDLHCNVGMARVIAAALEQSGAAALLDGGDTVVSGTSVESYCVNAFAGAVPDGVPVVVATGNHDSTTTAEQERKVGWTVLSGEIVEVAGLRILGDTDPTITTVGAGGTRQERDETIPELETRMAEVACAAAEETEPVDILLIHNPRVGGETLDRGCARLQLSGHWHRTEGPELQGQGVRYVSTSTGGGAGGGATVGPLNGAAELTVLRVDRATGEPLALRRIRVGTDAAVTLGSWEIMPVVPDAKAAPADGDTPADRDAPADGGGPADGDGSEAAAPTP